MENSVPLSVYWEEAVRTHSRYAYQKSASFLFQAARLFKLNPSSAEQKTLQIVFALMVFIDDAIDSAVTPQERKEFQDQIIERILFSQHSDAFPLVVDEMMRYTLDHLAESKNRIDLSRVVQAIFRQSERIREVGSVEELFWCTKEEGSLTGDLVMLFVKKSTPAFTTFILTLSQVGDLVDTAIDFKRDWRAGLLVVKPTIRNRFLYWWYTTRECVSFLKHCFRRPKLLFLTATFFFNWLCRMFRRAFLPSSL